MDLKKIKELIAAMEKAGLKKFRVKEENGFELELERLSDEGHPPLPRHHDSAHHFAPPPAPHAKPHHEEQPKPGTYVSSPMVGTYYSAPSPDDPPYLKIGDEVDENTVVCIIEAMKVMNEVKAGQKGRVAEILVNNADPVEFGTNLVRIE